MLFLPEQSVPTSHPLLHLRRLTASGIVVNYAQQFDTIWKTTRVIPDSPVMP
jgi:hypothetical protein